MPHTSHKKKKASPGKREQLDEDGWTRITSPKRTNMKDTTIPRPFPHSLNGPALDLARSASDRPYIPLDVSLREASKRYEILEKRWIESESWRVLMHQIEEYIKPERNSPITTCILLGSGRMCHSNDSLYIRYDVALLQTAVFKAVVDIIESSQNSRIRSYAQEPRYNDTDKEFLRARGITPVEDPEAFNLTDSNAFAYVPFSEHSISLRTVTRNPALLLASSDLSFIWRNEQGIATTHDLTDMATHIDNAQIGSSAAKQQQEIEDSCRILESFKENHASVAIPEFEMPQHPFHGQHLFYKLHPEVKEPTNGQVVDLATGLEDLVVAENPASISKTLLSTAT